MPVHNHSEDGDNHHHHHTLSVEQAASTAFKIGIGLNLLYVLAEVVAGFRTHSLALLTDAGHNFSDVLGLVLSLVAFRLARIKPTKTFTYGYKKSTILAALANAMLLLIAVGALGFESIMRLQKPQAIQGGIIAVVAGIGIVVNGVSAFLFFKTQKHELNARGAYLHLLADALISVSVMVSGIVISCTHWYWLDAVAGLAVLVVILIGTWSLLSDSLRLSLDAVPKGIELSEIQSLILTEKTIQDVRHIHVWAMSTTENAMTAHILFKTGIGEEEKQKTLKQIKHTLLHYNIHHVTLEAEAEGLAEKKF